MKTPAPASALRIRVPASTSNLGPGFDCLGLAFQLYNDFRIECDSGPGRRFEAEGPEAAGLLRSPNPGAAFFEAVDLFLAGQRRVGARVRHAQEHMSVRAWIEVPVARGLGSSTTALLAGLAAANHACGSPCMREDLARLAARIEGHPDNALPSTLGGLVAGAMLGDGRVRHVRHRLHRSVACVAIIPGYPMPTVEARRALPRQVPHRDAVFNLSRTPLVLEALRTGDLPMLADVVEDRLHEPYRKSMMKGFDEAVAAGRHAGAAAVFLSGAGSTLMALCARERAGAVGRAMVRVLRLAGDTPKCLLLAPDTRGMTIRPEK